MKHVFIVNPRSGKQGAAQAMVPRIERAAKLYGADYIIEETNAIGHAEALAERYAAGGEPVRLYAVGGDGTLNEVLNGCYAYPNAEVASVPKGSGNDFVRNFGRVEDFLDVATLMRGQAVPIDLMQVDDGICAAITSTGLDAEVAYNIPKYRRIPLLGGTMAYNLSIIEKLFTRLGRHLRIVIDGKIVEGHYLIATVCNGRTYGGGYCAAPQASLNDGVLEVILVRKVSRLLIASIIGGYKNGKHMKGGKVLPRYQKMMQHFRAKEVEITPLADEPFILNVDGECGPAPRLYAKVMPHAAKFVLPTSLAQRYGADHPPA